MSSATVQLLLFAFLLFHFNQKRCPSAIYARRKRSVGSVDLVDVGWQSEKRVVRRRQTCPRHRSAHLLVDSSTAPVDFGRDRLDEYCVRTIALERTANDRSQVTDKVDDLPV